MSSQYILWVVNIFNESNSTNITRMNIVNRSFFTAIAAKVVFEFFAAQPYSNHQFAITNEPVQKLVILHASKVTSQKNFHSYSTKITLLPSA